MDNFTALTEQVKEMFKGWNVINKPTLKTHAGLSQFLVKIKDSVVQIDSIHLMYYHDNQELIGTLNGKRMKDIIKELTEYKEQCLCN